VVAAVAASAGAGAPGGGRIVFASERAPDLGRTQFVSLAATGRPRTLGVAPPGAELAPDGRRYAAARGRALLVGTLGGAEPRVVATNAFEIAGIVWSPDGSRIAYEVANSSYCHPGDHLCVVYEIWVVSAAGGAPRMLASAARRPTWSPDGRMLAFAGDWETFEANDFGSSGRPYVVAASGGTPRRLSLARVVSSLAWAPGGDRLAFTYGVRGFAAVVSAAGGHARRLGRATAVAWTPTRDLVLARRNGSLAVVRADGRTVRTIPAVGGAQAIVPSPRGERLAYVARHGAAPSVGAVGLDGRGRRVLLRLDRFATVTQLGWSLDGSRVLVGTTRETNDTDLYTMRGDGTDVRRLTDTPAYESAPAWSPDARRVVFVGPGTGAHPRTALWMANADGRSRKRLTDAPLGSEDRDPAWSADGSRVVFVRERSPSGVGEGELWTVRPDGTGTRRLAAPAGELYAPAWSPDGSRIAFARVAALNAAVWLVNADGSGLRLLTSALFAARPSWSPDGTRLAFVDGDRVWTSNADGSGLTAIAEGAEWPAGAAAWSPDGTRIAYGGKDGDIHSVAATGGDDVNLTHSRGRDLDPSWSRASG
jgi:Tol biopolymer transport system component